MVSNGLLHRVAAFRDLHQAVDLFVRQLPERREQLHDALADLFGFLVFSAAGGEPSERLHALLFSRQARLLFRQAAFEFLTGLPFLLKIREHAALPGVVL
jgi:hypothetical protein